MMKEVIGERWAVQCVGVGKGAWTESDGSALGILPD